MYEVKKDASGEIEILHRDGKPLFCPFKSSILIPGRISGEMQLHREPCGSWCPHFEKLPHLVNLTCGHDYPKTFSITSKLTLDK